MSLSPGFPGPQFLQNELDDTYSLMYILWFYLILILSSEEFKKKEKTAVSRLYKVRETFIWNTDFSSQKFSKGYIAIALELKILLL